MARWTARCIRRFRSAHSTANGQEIKIDKVTGEVFELEDQMAMLVGAIREGGEISCSAEDGRWSVAMCLAAQQSVDCGRPVAIGDAA